MIKVDTIQQFNCLEWIKKNFFIEQLQITIFDKDTLLIKDKNDEEAFVKTDIDGSVGLLFDLWILSVIHENYAVYLYADLEKVVEANDYVMPINISSFANKEDAYRELKLLVNKEENEEGNDYGI